MSRKVKTKTDELIDQAEQAFSIGQEFFYAEVGRYKWSVSNLRALKNRGYRIERQVLGAAYRVYPKAPQAIVEKTYTMELTEGEIIAVRELVRKFPRGNEFATDYAAELFSLDKKTTAKLSDIFDENMAAKKT